MIGLVISAIAVLLVGLTSAHFLRRVPCNVALDASKFQPFTLIERRQVSYDSLIFRFALQHPNQTLGLPIGQHILLRALCEVNGSKEMVQHSYTPISSNDEKGYVDFLIKVYFAGVHPKFPHGGRLTQYIYNLKLNDTIDMQGPKGRFEYLGNGNCSLNTSPTKTETLRVDSFAMVAGGSGITPLLQIIRAVRKNPNDKTTISLLYANQTPEDILLRDELDVLARESNGQVRVWYTVDRGAPAGWAYDVGFITAEMLRDHLPLPPTPDEVPRSVLALVCGPPAMNHIAVKPNLEKLGYSQDRIFIF